MRSAASCGYEFWDVLRYLISALHIEVMHADFGVPEFKGYPASTTYDLRRVHTSLCMTVALCYPHGFVEIFGPAAPATDGFLLHAHPQEYAVICRKLVADLHMKATITTCLVGCIFRWLNRRYIGSKQILLLHVGILPFMCGLVPMRPFGAFLAVSSSRIYYTLPAPNTASEWISLLPTSPIALCSLGSTFSFPARASQKTSYETSSALKRWPTCMCSAVAARGEIHFRYSFSLLRKKTDAFFRCCGPNIKFTHLLKSRVLDFSKEEISHNFSRAHIRARKLPCVCTIKSGRGRSLKKDVLFLELASCPRTRSTSAVAGAPAAPAAQQVSEKKSSDLFDALKRLRSLTGCSVVVCREALVTCNGDIHAAVDWLRRKGIAGPGSATTQALNTLERPQTEGVVAVASWRPSAAQKSSNSQKGRTKGATPGSAGGRHEGEVALRLTCSTDFVARNRRITHFARRAATLLAEHLKEVGLQDMLTESVAPRRHAESRQDARSSTTFPAQAEGERFHSASVPQPPLHSASCGVVVVRGTPLVERLLNLPWEPGEELRKEGEAFAAEATRSGGGNFFQEQQQLEGALQQQKRRQSAGSSANAQEKKQDQIKAKKLAEGSAAKERAPKRSQFTVREELQYLSSIVREPLSIADAVAMEAPTESGAVASYVHGIIDNHVGTLAVLAALSVEHDRNTCDARTRHQPSSTSAGAASLQGVKKRRDPQGLPVAQQQLHPDEEAPQKHSGKKTEKDRRTSLESQQLGHDVLQREKEPLLESIYEVAERMHGLAEGICMQIAAGRPVAVDERSLDHALFEREERIYRAQAEATGKPPATVERMVTGKMNKWLKDVLLVKQTWLLDDSGKTVQQKLVEFAVQQRMKKNPRIETFVKIQVH